MGTLSQISKVFIFTGFALIIIGLMISLGFGKLPGDIHIKNENFTFIFPVVSCIIASVILTIFFMVFKK
jgi:hypothetical protein